MVEARWILVAEDDDEIRQMITDSLRREAEGLSLNVVEAKDGTEAIVQVSRREFHCVITDLRMPKATGEDLIRTIQSQSLNSNTPLLVVSGHMGDEDGERFSKKYSHVRTIPKPFEAAELARVAIREVKLGRMDKRPAAHLMNPFLDALGKFASEYLSENLKVEHSTLPASLKKPGEGLIGDIHCVLQLTSANSKAKITLSFDSIFLEFVKSNYLNGKTTQWAILTPEGIAKHTCQAIFDASSPQLSKLMGGQVRLSGTSIFTYKSENDYSELVRSTGITIVVKTTKGRAIVGAFVRPKAKPKKT